MKSLFGSALLSITALLLVSSGCQKQSSSPVAGPAQDTATVPAPSSHSDESVVGHSHGAGPNGGTIADWGGGKYHVEFTVDHDKKEATVYILGTDEKTPTAIKAEDVQLTVRDPAMQVVLKPAPIESDAAGSASRFTGTHESLGTVQEYEGTITGVIDETPYSGDFKEHP